MDELITDIYTTGKELEDGRMETEYEPMIKLPNNVLYN